ncbi:hypothetical protein [Faecalispora anaeroviscerum]|uniref:hypothetical protein n=1 Tax=Faecalispora anaeroviscerum TaxID=2991836 RepID=UPI0024B8B525|nr:hypothetical protein [Faecalispora anaeroviscerum]
MLERQIHPRHEVNHGVILGVSFEATANAVCLMLSERLDATLTYMSGMPCMQGRDKS